jgi:hypothetical protein
LVSLLKHLDRDDQSVARGFYLSGWSGTQPYTFDRILRGHLHIDAVCLSVLGNTQPARIAEYIHRANYAGAGGDGLIQRFGLLVWPDAPADWKNVDEYPNREAREKAWAVFQRVSKINESTALKLGLRKVLSTKYRLCASTRPLKRTSSIGEKTLNGECGPAISRPPSRGISRNIAPSFRPWH